MGDSFTTSKQSSTSTSNPTQNSNVTNFRNSLYPQISNYLSMASAPTYGAPQQAQFTDNLNKTSTAATNTLASQLAARTGSVNSGAFASGATGIQQSKLGSQANYAAAVPAMNKQATMQNLGQGLQIGNAIAGPALTTNTTQNNETYDPSMYSSILGGVGAATGALGGIAGAGGFGNILQSLGIGGGPSNGGNMDSFGQSMNLQSILSQLQYGNKGGFSSGGFG